MASGARRALAADRLKSLGGLFACSGEEPVRAGASRPVGNEAYGAVTCRGGSGRAYLTFPNKNAPPEGRGAVVGTMITFHISVQQSSVARRRAQRPGRAASPC